MTHSTSPPNAAFGTSVAINDFPGLDVAGHAGLTDHPADRGRSILL